MKDTARHMTVMKTFNSTVNLSKYPRIVANELRPRSEPSPRRNAKKSRFFGFSFLFSLEIERKGRPHFDLAIAEAHRD
jgi:hypothetical protein